MGTTDRNAIREPTVTLFSDGTAEAHGMHSLSEETQMFWDRVEANAVERTLLRLNENRMLSVPLGEAAKIFGVKLPA